MTGVLKKNTGIEISPCDDRSRGCGNAATSQAGEHQGLLAMPEAGKRHGRVF